MKLEQLLDDAKVEILSTNQLKYIKGGGGSENENSSSTRKNVT